MTKENELKEKDGCKPSAPVSCSVDRATRIGLWLAGKIRSIRRWQRKKYLAEFKRKHGVEITQVELWGDEI